MSGKILIVEDVPINLTLFMMHLKKHGYEVQGAPNGQEGLKLAKVMSFDLILLDAKLPDMEGSQLITFLKAEDRLKDVPIIIISAQSLEEAKISKDLVSGHLLKPVQPGILIQKIREILPGIQEDKRKKEEERAKLNEMEVRAEQRKSSSGVQVIDGFPVETVSVSDLKPGMETGDQVTDHNSISIMPMGVSLTDKHIEKLNSLGIKEILVRK